MPVYEYTCEYAHTTERLRPYAEREEMVPCAFCESRAYYAGLSAPAIAIAKPTAAIMADGRRVEGTFATPPKKFRQRPR